MGLVELELTKRNDSLEAGLFFAHDALLGHLTTHESNLSLQRQIFRAEVVASQEGHTAENSAFSNQDFIENELQQIEEFMKDLTNLEPGDVADVDWLPSRGTFVYYNGQLMGNPVRGKALYDAVLSIWLGDHALEEGLREGLLSLPKEEKEN